MAFNLLFPDGRQQGNTAYRAETESARKRHPQPQDWYREWLVKHFERPPSHTSAWHTLETVPRTASRQVRSQPPRVAGPSPGLAADCFGTCRWLIEFGWCMPPSTTEQVWRQKPPQGAAVTTKSINQPGCLPPTISSGNLGPAHQIIFGRRVKAVTATCWAITMWNIHMPFNNSGWLNPVQTFTAPPFHWWENRMKWTTCLLPQTSRSQRLGLLHAKA